MPPFSPVIVRTWRCVAVNSRMKDEGSPEFDSQRAMDLTNGDPSSDARENPLTLALSPQSRGEGTRKDTGGASGTLSNLPGVANSSFFETASLPAAASKTIIYP